MATSIPDLWPPDIFTTPAPTPIAVLRRQGEALGAHTQNLVHGEVETTTNPDGKSFTHTLYLSAPLLRYRRPLLNVDQTQPQAYPAIVWEADLTRPPNDRWSREVANEEELQACIQEFLNEPRVKNILRSVINMSNDVAPAE